MLGLSLSIPDLARVIGASLDHPYYVVQFDGVPYQVPRAIPDSLAVLWTVIDPVLSSDGTPYNPI
jgi:hypothetical protein